MGEPSTTGGADVLAGVLRTHGDAILTAWLATQAGLSPYGPLILPGSWTFD